MPPKAKNARWERIPGGMNQPYMILSLNANSKILSIVQHDLPIITKSHFAKRCNEVTKQANVTSTEQSAISSHSSAGEEFYPLIDIRFSGGLLLTTIKRPIGGERYGKKSTSISIYSKPDWISNGLIN